MFSGAGAAIPSTHLSVNTTSKSAEIITGRVLYDFSAEADGDLSLMVGDTVTIIEHVDADWTRGLFWAAINNQLLHILSYFIQIHCPLWVRRDVQGCFIVIVLYHNLYLCNSGTFNGRTGIFPRSFVEVLGNAAVKVSSISPNNIKALMKSEISPSPGRVDRREVLFDFVAQQHGDLTAFQGLQHYF